MSQRRELAMAPDGHSQTPEPTGEEVPEQDSEVDIPVSNGILSKGPKTRKRVTFRDSNLCTFKEIPPRSRSGSSASGSGDSDDEDDDSGSDSDTDSGSESGSDDEDDDDDDNAKKVSKVVAKAKAAVPLAKHSHVTPVSVHHGPRVRSERAPIVWSSTTSFSAAKGSYDVTASPASRVVSLVSQITGVSSSAAQTHAKQRASPTPKPAPPPKKPVPVVKVEKKMKKITPTLDGLLSPQPPKTAHKHGSGSDAGNRAGAKTVRKKRVYAKKSDGSDKRRTVLRKTKDHKPTGGRPNSTSPVPEKVKMVRPHSQLAVSARDSLTLPRLAADDSLVTQTSKSVQQLSIGKLYTLDGFIFPGDPAHDIAQGVKAAVASGDSKLQPQTAFSPTPGAAPVHHPRERVSSAPPASASRRKRYYAWQMANGNMQSTLQETPCIAPMWETMQTVTTFPSKPGSVTDR